MRDCARSAWSPSCVPDLTRMQFVLLFLLLFVLPCVSECVCVCPVLVFSSLLGAARTFPSKRTDQTNNNTYRNNKRTPGWVRRRGESGGGGGSSGSPCCCCCWVCACARVIDQDVTAAHTVATTKTKTKKEQNRQQKDTRKQTTRDTPTEREREYSCLVPSPLYSRSFRLACFLPRICICSSSAA